MMNKDNLFHTRDDDGIDGRQLFDGRRLAAATDGTAVASSAGVLAAVQGLALRRQRLNRPPFIEFPLHRKQQQQQQQQRLRWR